MEKVTTAKRLLIVKLYLSGLSYDEIVVKTGISRGTVANVWGRMDLMDTKVR